MRDALIYKNYLTNTAKPHACEDYITRLINDVIHHSGTEQRLLRKKAPWTLNEFKINLMHKSREILENLSQWHRGGRNPFILTGAIIYLADKLLAEENEHKAVLTQNLISEATNIAEYSIRDHYVNLLKPLFFPKEEIKN